MELKQNFIEMLCIKQKEVIKMLQDEFYTVSEVAQLFKCSKNTVYNLIKQKKIKSFNIIGGKRIPREEIERLKAGSE